MSNFNPYAPIQVLPIDDSRIGHVSIRPVELLKRSYALIRNQYWLFFGIVLVGIFLGSAVPFGILIGPFTVGIYLCYIQREQGQPVEFGTLFKGFDLFLNSFLAVLIMMGILLLVMIPLVVLFVILLFLMMPRQGAEPSIAIFAMVAFFYLTLVVVGLLTVTPFMFTFQLIADRGLSAGQALWASAQGVRSNFLGLIWFMLVMLVISTLCTMMCYIPVFLAMPIMMGASFLLYRDIYGPRPVMT